MSMEVIPAIDLKDGACVRLFQGDFDQETVFSRDPVDMALRWQSAGATRIHVVDLDGSRTGTPSNLGTIEKIADAVSVPLQVGGGIRSRDTAHRLLEAGVGRIVIGTAAVEDAEMVEELCRDWGQDRLVVAVETRDGKVAIKGWLEQVPMNAVDLVLKMSKLGARRFLYTDVSRDGTMTSPNFEGVASMVTETGQTIIASGGVSSLADIRRLAVTGAEGAIVGRALYQGAIDLAEAIKAGNE